MSERIASLSRAPTANMHHPPTPHPMFSTNGKRPYQDVDPDSEDHSNGQQSVKRTRSCLSQVSFDGHFSGLQRTENVLPPQISKPAISGPELLRRIRDTLDWSEVVERSLCHMKPSEFKDFMCRKLQRVLEQEMILPYVNHMHLPRSEGNEERAIDMSSEEDNRSDYEGTDSEFEDDEDDFTSDADEDQSDYDLLEDDDFDGGYESESDD